MPDQSSASTEHAIMQEITAPLSTLPDDALPVAADVDFPVVLRGYDRIAVDAYVKKTSQLVAELQATRSPEAAVRRALERVGEEVSGILQRAHDTASQITAQSRSEAEDRLDIARQEAAETTTQAADRVKELDLETDRIWEERLRIVEDARELARQLLALAESAAKRFPAETEQPSEVFTNAEPAAEELTVHEPEPGVEQPGLVAEWAQGTHETPPAPAEDATPPAPAQDATPPAPAEDETPGDEPFDRDATAVMPTVELPDEDDRPL